MRAEVLRNVLGEFLGVVDSDNHVGGLRVDVLEEDEVIDAQGLQGGHLPEKHLRGEDY